MCFIAILDLLFTYLAIILEEFSYKIGTFPNVPSDVCPSGVCSSTPVEEIFNFFLPEMAKNSDMIILLRPGQTLHKYYHRIKEIIFSQ